ncbi:hypothetical protein [Nocardioides zeae]
MTAEGHSGVDAGVPGTGLPYPPTPADIAEALRSDPVLVDPMFGNGATQAVRDGFTELAGQSEHQVFVVLVPLPASTGDDPERDLALLLSSQEGLGDGYYVVDVDPGHSTGEVVAVGVPDTSVYGIIQDLAPDTYASGTYDGSVLPSDTGTLAMALDIQLREGEGFGQDEYDVYAQTSPWASPPRWESSYDHQPPDPGAYWAFGTMAFVVAAGATWVVARQAATWGRRATHADRPMPEQRLRDQSTSLSPSALRARVEEELDAVAERRASLERGTFDDARWARIDASDEAARLVLARVEERDRDVPDLVGALVLARTASFALEDARGRNAPYRPCFFDPRHGRGVKRRRVPVADTSLDVACCSICARRELGAITPLRDGRRPYYERDTVWARTGYGAVVDDLPFQVLDHLRETR